MKYPQEAVKNGIQGRVLVDFIIDENGKIIFDKFISGTGAKPVMYVAWSLRGEAEKQPSMTAAYTKLAGYTGGLVAPAGEAWQKALRLRPAPEIYKEDGNHPTRAGTYLCSLCIFYAITGRKKSMALGERGYFSDYGLDRHAAVAFNRIASMEARKASWPESQVRDVPVRRVPS